MSYVVVNRPHSYAVGTRRTFVTVASSRKLDDCPGLTRVLATSHLLVYRVDR